MQIKPFLRKMARFWRWPQTNTEKEKVFFKPQLRMGFWYLRTIFALGWSNLVYTMTASWHTPRIVPTSDGSVQTKYFFV